MGEKIVVILIRGKKRWGIGGEVCLGKEVVRTARPAQVETNIVGLGWEQAMHECFSLSFNCYFSLSWEQLLRFI